MEVSSFFSLIYTKKIQDFEVLFYDQANKYIFVPLFFFQKIKHQYTHALKIKPSINMLTFYDFLKKRLGSYVSTGYKIYKTVTNNNKKEEKIRRIDYLVFFCCCFFLRQVYFFIHMVQERVIFLCIHVNMQVKLKAISFYSFFSKVCN